ncbi:zinc finger protein 830-like isoform X1 [Hydra vulgaris]|uniref:Zinc finger protein 830 n=2 Tax=Hydra vulgaris TaxID=6087 RepID=A0ABM4CX88_HYDVU
MAAARADELRKLMKLQKAAGSVKKINHPLAKYNNLDQIVCIVCDLTVKNEIMWNTHLQSRKHKENVVMLKTKSSKQAVPQNVVQINKKDDILPTKKDVLPPDFFDLSVEKVADGLALKKPLSTEQPVSQLSVASEPSTNVSLDSSVLPNDFFDEQEDNKVKVELKEEKSKSSNRKRKNSGTESEKLPEGFFDDPKKDAKARNVEYKDPKDEEWEKFQQIIQEETKVSEAIQDEEDEEAEMMKDMQEYINLKSCLLRVDKLKGLMQKKKVVNKKETIQDKLQSVIKKEEISDKTFPEDNNDENELQNLYNWRAKTL